MWRHQISLGTADDKDRNKSRQTFLQFFKDGPDKVMFSKMKQSEMEVPNLMLLKLALKDRARKQFSDKKDGDIVLTNEAIEKYRQMKSTIGELLFTTNTDLLISKH